MAEMKDLNFAKISARIFGKDTTYSVDSGQVAKFEYFVSVDDQLPGTIYISQMITFKNALVDFDKLSAVSYNYGKSFIPLRYMKSQKQIGWSSCKMFIPPHGDSLKEAIQTAQHNPLLMVAKIVIKQKDENASSKFMVSNDAGYTWKDNAAEFEEMKISNEGEVILGKNSKLSFTTNQGGSWEDLNLGINGHKLKYLIVGEKAAKYKFFTLIYSEEWPDVGFAVVDFTKLFQQKCKPTDYKVVTPGVGRMHSCFNGGKNFLYSKKSHDLCEGSIHSLPKIQPVPCNCTQMDYKW
ncbi:Vacuolar protein sorting/targeting protein 10 [Thelohanellus kitauei]|uniref:Vacuolar protein sorting/targeting protein 10 n=1 Tax=Thelohanellus kitauei TaxID=669202 RepID=A0A0C2MT20_THEKT|nr:Vacuolar protein sorting/targeting protein 10 [Thelohanellus kitauei]